MTMGEESTIAADFERERRESIDQHIRIEALKSAARVMSGDATALRANSVAGNVRETIEMAREFERYIKGTR